jgi:hypothetical protein
MLLNEYEIKFMFRKIRNIRNLGLHIVMNRTDAQNGLDFHFNNLKTDIYHIENPMQKPKYTYVSVNSSSAHPSPRATPGPSQLFLIPGVGLLPKFFSPGMGTSTFSIMADYITWQISL